MKLSEQTFYEYLQAFAEEEPHKPLYMDDRKTLSANEVQEAVDQLAKQLYSLGVTPGSFVALHMERSVDGILLLLALWALGLSRFLPRPISRSPISWRGMGPHSRWTLRLQEVLLPRRKRRGRIPLLLWIIRGSSPIWRIRKRRSLTGGNTFIGPHRIRQMPKTIGPGKLPTLPLSLRISRIFRSARTPTPRR